MRHLDAEGRSLLETAEPGAVHLLEIAPGPTPDRSPGIAVELRIQRGCVQAILWLAGEPFGTLPPPAKG